MYKRLEYSENDALKISHKARSCCLRHVIYRIMPRLANLAQVKVEKCVTPITTDLRSHGRVAHMEIAGVRPVGGGGGERAPRLRFI